MVESQRDDRNHGLRLGLAGILSSLRDFLAADSEPSDKSLGYFRSSLRDSRPAAPAFRRRGATAPFHRKQRGTNPRDPLTLFNSFPHDNPGPCYYVPPMPLRRCWFGMAWRREMICALVVECATADEMQNIVLYLPL